MIGELDHLLNFAPLFAPDWFVDAFIAIFDFPCYFRIQCGKYFSNFCLYRMILHFFGNFFIIISLIYILQQNLNILSSLAHGFFNYTTSNMVTDLHDAELDKRQRKPFQRLDEPPESSSKK